MSRKSQEEVTTEYWSKLSSQSSPSMKKDTNKEGPHNKEENEVEDLVEEWLLHQNTEIRSRWRIHCRCFPGISQATRNQTSLKGRIEQSLTWPEALTSNHTIPPTDFSDIKRLATPQDIKDKVFETNPYDIVMSLTRNLGLLRLKDLRVFKTLPTKSWKSVSLELVEHFGNLAKLPKNHKTVAKLPRLH
ncbi:hypothetical protein ACOSQ4_032226 [Xanthoceras sorbifolium]